MNAKIILSAVAAAFLAAPLMADETANVVGRIQGYKEVLETLNQEDEPNLVLYQMLAKDLDQAREKSHRAIDEMSQRRFGEFVAEMQNEELSVKIAGLEATAARDLVKREISRDILGKKMALADSLPDMQPEKAKAAIAELFVQASSPEANQAFIKDLAKNWGAKVGNFFGVVVGNILGHTLFAVSSTIVTIGAGPFLVCAKILSAGGKAAYVGYQYTKEFQFGLRKGIKEGWRSVRGVLEGEAKGLSD